jgi:CRP-like cAMP-binding protein
MHPSFDFFDSIYPLSQESKLQLLQLLKEKTFEKNEIIQPNNSSCRNIYIVKSGIARIFYYKNDIDITEHFAFDNELIVRAESLFTGKPTQKGIQAIDKTEIVSIDSTALFSLYNNHHDIERLFRLVFEREYVNTIKRLESLQFKSASERYAELLTMKDMVLRIPLKYLASYLGITQVSLSRIRKSTK